MIRTFRIARHFFRLQRNGWAIGHQSNGNNLHSVTITKDDDRVVLRYKRNGKLDTIEANHKEYEDGLLMLHPYTAQELYQLIKVLHGG